MISTAILDKYREIVNVPNEEDAPFESYYKGREYLQSALTEIESALDRAEILATLGSNFQHCEEPHNAIDSLTNALRLFLSIDPTLRYEGGGASFIVGLFNELSSVWGSRGDGKRALQYALHAKRILGMTGRKVDSSHKINNTFQLAKSLGSVRRPDLASVLCCETLNMQLNYNMGESALEGDDPWLGGCNREWLRRCADLAVFFVNEGLFWCSEYLLHCGLALTEIEKSSESLRGEALRDLGKFYKSRMIFTRHCAHFKSDDEAIRAWREITTSNNIPVEEYHFNLALENVAYDDAIPRIISLEPGQFKLAREAFNVDNASLVFKDLNVKLPIILDYVHDRAVARIVKINGDLIESFVKAGKYSHRLSACGAGDASSAKESFKLGLHFCNQALDIFKLDTCASDHIEVSMEVASLYECVQEWETEDARVIAILKRRIKILEPLLSSVNQAVFTVFARTASFSLGEIFSDLYTLRNDESFIDKCVMYFEMFTNTFKTQSKQSTEIGDDADACFALARAHLNIGRMEMKRRGDFDKQKSSEKAINAFKWFIDFVKNTKCLRDEPSMRDNLQTCHESIALISSRRFR